MLGKIVSDERVLRSKRFARRDGRPMKGQVKQAFDRPSTAAASGHLPCITPFAIAGQAGESSGRVSRGPDAVFLVKSPIKPIRRPGASGARPEQQDGATRGRRARSRFESRSNPMRHPARESRADPDDRPPTTERVRPIRPIDLARHKKTCIPSLHALDWAETGSRIGWSRRVWPEHPTAGGAKAVNSSRANGVFLSRQTHLAPPAVGADNKLVVLTETIQFQATPEFRREFEAEASKLHLSLSAHNLYLHTRMAAGQDGTKLDRHVREVFGTHGDLMRRLAK